jgi:hypothetical protein
VSDYERYILEHFHYSDGTITRDDRKGGTGSLDKDGYLIIKVKGKQFKAHRIAWLLNYGSFPESELDHINRNKLDNRIENLRESNRQEQIANRDYRPNPRTGVVGVYEDRFTRGLKKKYATKIKGKTYRFYTVNDAAKFRREHGLWV